MDKNKTTEFDNYAKDYEYGFDNPIKKLLGSKPDDFFNTKINWLNNFIKKVPYLENKKIEILDFGCGTGLFLKQLKNLNLNANLSGVEISVKMLEAAKKNLGPDFYNRLYLLPDDLQKITHQKYDLIILSSVLHHIDVNQRTKTFYNLSELLNPKGFLIIFEHNPLNPITKLVVKNTKIDKNAILLKPQEIVEYFTKTGQFDFFKLEYIMFFPPRLNTKITTTLEKKLARIPFGAQYVIVGRKLA